MKKLLSRTKTEHNTLVYSDGTLLGKLVDSIVYSMDGAICYGIDPLEDSVDNKKLRNIKILPGTKVIAKEAFLESVAIKDIELPDSVEIIEENAFLNSNIENINLDNVLSFGESVFADSLIRNAVINKNAKFDVGPNNGSSSCFSNCRLLESIDFGPDVVPKHFCTNCSMLKKFDHHDNLLRIDSFAFYSCGALENFVFPEGLRSIDDNAFGCSMLKSASFPSTLEMLGNHVFGYCSALSSITFASSDTELKIYSGCFMDTLPSSIFIPKNVMLEDSSIFRNCAALESVEVLSKIKELPSDTFNHCERLKNVILNPYIKSIGHTCFYGTALEKITDVFKDINFFDYQCFGRCKKLKFAHMPKKATLKSKVFVDCDNLELAIIESKDISDTIFQNCPKDLHIIAPCFEGTFYSTQDKLAAYTTEKINEENIDILLGYMSFKEISKMSDNFLHSKTQENKGIVK